MKGLPIAKSERGQVRECGDCQVCCEVLEVRPDNTIAGLAMSKRFDRCQWQGEKCCKIYDNRPRPCAVYTCMWVLGWGPDSARPDIFGVVLEGTPVNWIMVIESRPGGYDEPAVRELLLASMTTGSRPVDKIHVARFGDGLDDGFWIGGEPTMDELQEAWVLQEGVE